MKQDPNRVNCLSDVITVLYHTEKYQPVQAIVLTKKIARLKGHCMACIIFQYSIKMNRVVFFLDEYQVTFVKNYCRRIVCQKMTKDVNNLVKMSNLY